MLRLFISQLLLYHILVFAAKNYVVKVKSYENGSNSWCKIRHIKLVRVNQTMSKVEGRVVVLNALPNNSLVDFVGMEYVGNRYVENMFAAKRGLPLCSLFTKPEYQKVSEKYRGLPSGCPITKGNYTIKNFKVDESRFPDNLPVQDNWRVDITVKSDNKVRCMNQVFLYIDRSVKG